MSSLYKIVSRQDANYKLSPSTSNETSINLSKDIAAMIAPQSGPVSFILHRKDFLMALGAIAQISPLYTRNDLIDLSKEFPELYKQIERQFDFGETSAYEVEFLAREDGRYYLKGLKAANGFNLRSFLIESHSQLDFSRNPSGDLVLRLHSSVTKNFPNSTTSRGIVSPEIAKDVEEAFRLYFRNYLRLKSEKGENTEIERYFRVFRQLVEKGLQMTNPNLSSIFQIVDKRLLEDMINASIATGNIIELFGSSTWNSSDNKNGKYEAWTLLRHYKAFLDLFSANKSIAGAMATSSTEDIPEDEDQDENAITRTQTDAAKLPLQVIFYGAPGTGKSHTIDEIADDNHCIRTTFHPDSDYASFVGAYKPTMEDVRISSASGDSVQFAEGIKGHPGTERKIVYKYVPQAFLKAYVHAWKNLSTPCYLIIEEINRGNCAQIFGDLFQLLDRNMHGSSSYAVHADDDIRQFLCGDSNGFASLTDEQRRAIESFVLIKDNGEKKPIGRKILNGEQLLLPPNLRIWATMNTSDQSLFPIDSAFKRRWNWKYIPISYDKKNWLLHVGSLFYSWGDFLRKINPIISELTESADKQMGYFFAKPDEKQRPDTSENDTISEDIFLNKVLFYLWTDVLKDYDAGKEPFLNPDTGRAYEFCEFFDPNHSYIQQFMAKLELQATDPNKNDDTETTGTESVTEDISEPENIE